jgi:hypothetical protein
MEPRPILPEAEKHLQPSNGRALRHHQRSISHTSKGEFELVTQMMELLYKVTNPLKDLGREVNGTELRARVRMNLPCRSGRE